MKKLKALAAGIGWPRLIIGGFLAALFAAAPFVKVGIGASIGDLLTRFGMNGIMVLAMVPMIQSGCGLNFGLPVGVIAGLLGATLSIELGAAGPWGFLLAAVMALAFAAVFGYGYGRLLNRVKGDEMMIATYVGFSAVMLMSILWLVLPYASPTMVWAYGGRGLRTTISVEKFWSGVLSNFLSFKVGPWFSFPTGMILAFAVLAFLVWAFFRTKTGTALTAVGSNPVFARASGIDVDRMRIISVVMSTMIGAVGILVYEQSFGFIQLYGAPQFMAFPAVAAILIGGASVNKASLGNVIVGTLLFQGILTMTPSVINSVLHTDMSEVIRIIVTNGMILYALTRKRGGRA